ncbi:nuclear transport factor 2 family protein [Microbacterium trichothecenolyticum]
MQPNDPSSPTGGAPPRPLILRAFTHHWLTGDVSGMRRYLADDATLIADGGGQVPVPTHPITGRADVATALAQLVEITADAAFEQRNINAAPGVVIRHRRCVVAVAVFALEGAEISRVWLVANPAKLTHWNRA